MLSVVRGEELTFAHRCWTYSFAQPSGKHLAMSLCALSSGNSTLKNFPKKILHQFMKIQVQGWWHCLYWWENTMSDGGHAPWLLVFTSLCGALPLRVPGTYNSLLTSRIPQGWVGIVSVVRWQKTAVLLANSVPCWLCWREKVAMLGRATWRGTVGGF